MSDEAVGQSNIAKRIIDGLVMIESIEEFENLLKLFPDDPALHLAYGDLLVRQKSLYAAAIAYDAAAKLSMDKNLTMKAVLSKISKWRFLRPSQQESWAFYTALCEGRSKDTPLKNFLSLMAYPEMAVFDSLSRVSLSSGQVVKKFGDEENFIYFVASGALKETTFHPLEEGEKTHRKSTTDLVENDFFGDIYPFEEERVSQSDVETINLVELVKISKTSLMAACEKYPQVESSLESLYRARSESDGDQSYIIRKTARRQLSTTLNMIFFQTDGKNPMILKGFTDDISLGGVKVVLGPRYNTVICNDIIGRKVGIEIDIPTVGAKLSITGTVVWSKNVFNEMRASTVVGVQFEKMTDADYQVLKEFCIGSNGEQNLMWSLWESLVKR